ncbi:MAG: GAF domain-containing protein [Anaerolineae bacterium]|nr:GAF domain-containing protein [Anaerolineae bacterium]
MAQISRFFSLRRLVRRDFVVKQALVYSLLLLLLALGYALMVSGFGVIFHQIFPYRNPVLVGVVVFILALLILPLRMELEKTIDKLFFRGAKVYQERLQDFSSDLTGAVGLAEIVKLVRQYLEKTLAPSILHIYLYDPLCDEYVATYDETRSPTSDIRFSANSQLVQQLSSMREPWRISLGALPKNLQPEANRIRLLGAHIYTPLVGQERLAGWIALGPHVTGRVYSPREIVFLDAISDQAAVAIERAQVIARMEERVREMNVLALVAQGINVTLSLDDILELIYAQTSQIIPLDDFRILLSDEQTGALTHIFYIENGERLHQLENKPLDGGDQLLEQEVIRQRRSVITADYARECKARGFPVDRPGVLAWLGVPLNAGAETIGMMNLASRDVAVRYTAEQLNLLQAIADQAAGAIIKARLLEETQRRERHLKSLNEVSRQLTSTLELEPLLQNIMQSAVDILSCEAGSLLLVDEQTGELVFRVVLGPVAQDLINRRMAPGSGLVGKAVVEKSPVIVNDVLSSSEWFSKTDQETGFVTRAVLVVPMILLDKVVGVIEVINKRNREPFSREDQDLLTAFAAQAVVAIQNARLYTMTDQALASRVEELSVLQRIGRELNTSLDVTRAMTITLDWALRQTEFQAGMVGLIEGECLKVMAFQGYTDELHAFPDLLIPVDQRHLQEVVAGGVPREFLLSSEQEGFLLQAKTQLITPIQREQKTIGLLVLESASVVNREDMLGFLQRLSDQASIAIANAQLYAAVQAANMAKSEFVSFVSHELKNPMTSIKGYTELLAAGAVGPVTESQANFLATIKANVERMATLVSDLADVSRIEANRLRLDFKALKPREVLDEVIRSMRRQIDEKSQELVIDYPDDLPDVWADRTRLTQVMTNLVSNAHKYTPTGGKLFLSAEASDNRWDENGASKVVHFWVTDTGYGISPEDQKKIFQKFFRSEDPKAREAPGTGLGLNITKSLVEMQGGRIWFESEYRVGTTFHFTVPVAG